MDPLSALHFLTARNALPMAPLDPKLEPTALKAISPADIEKMSPVIPSIPSPPSGPVAAPLAGSAPAQPAQFESVLKNFVHEVNDKQTASNQAVQGLLTGQNVSLHQAMIAMEEASVSFQLMVEVRNKLLESYQELMRMQI